MGAPIRLRAGPLTLDLDPQGALITRFSWTGEDGAETPLMRTATDQSGDPLSAGCFPLLPFGNRVRGNRFRYDGADYAFAPNQPWDRHYLHGDGWLSLWSVVDHTERSLTLAMRRAGDRQSPYSYDAAIDFALGDDGLRVGLEVTNRHQARLPFGFGLHPYFPLTPLTTVQAPATTFFAEGADYMPGGPAECPRDLEFTAASPLPRRWINNGFGGWNGQAEILWPERRLGLRVDADPSFRFYFLFMSDRRFEPGFRGDYFCFEPMTHAADGHHEPDLGGLVALAPGERLAASVVFRVLHRGDG